MTNPYLSVVIPVYNEEESLPILYDRLTTTLDSLNVTYEIVFTNDGSSDRSIELLRDYHQRRPHQIRVIDFQGNYGQHMAIMAGFEHAKGELLMTMDADLQNPPEEIPALLEKVKAGHDYVGSYRAGRKDSFFLRTFPSRLVNYLRESITNVKMRDHGCMLRAYSRSIVEQIIASKERATFIPALAYQFAGNPTEVPIRHDVRAAGESKYDFYRLTRVFFDLITSFSLLPLHLFTLFGMFISGCSALLVFYLVIRRLVIGPEAEGVFTLLAILIFLVSVAITGIGLVGEYIGRIAQMVSHRPRYVVKELIEPVYEKTAKKAASK